MSNVKRFFASLVKLARDRYQLDVPKGAHVQNSSLCVTFGAPWFGPKNRSFCECSKYVTFSTIFCAPVRRTTVCVAPRARRCEVPCRALGDLLAASSARSRHECRNELGAVLIRPVHAVLAVLPALLLSHFRMPTSPELRGCSSAHLYHMYRCERFSGDKHI